MMERKGGGHDKCGIGGRRESGRENRKKKGLLKARASAEVCFFTLD